MRDPFALKPRSKDIKVEKVTKGFTKFSVVYFKENHNLKALITSIDNNEGRSIYQASFNNIKSSYIRDDFENAVSWCENTLREYIASLK